MSSESIPINKWSVLNDTIMGGASQSSCVLTSDGLVFDCFLVEENGGFVSCRSPLFAPALDLSSYKGLEFSVDGFGNILKLAISCSSPLLDISTIFFERLKWVSEINTNDQGTTQVRLPFRNFQPMVRSKPFPVDVKLRSQSINQFQLLYSKFGVNGQRNASFKSGPITIILRSIRAYI